MGKRARIRLIHWKPEEAVPRVAWLEQLGYEVDASAFQGSSMQEFRQNPPAAVVIDLSRLPSHGREVGISLRQSKTTRLIPLVYVEGAADKVEKVIADLPDARFTTYEKVGPVLEDVLSAPLAEVVIPKDLGGRSPLVTKLGVKDGQTLGLIDAPIGFEALLPGVTMKRNALGALTLWFFTSLAAYRKALPKIRESLAVSGAWVVWPKRTSGVVSDLTSDLVRLEGIGAGLVDFKICSVDETWTGMRFAVKKK